MNSKKSFLLITSIFSVCLIGCTRKQVRPSFIDDAINEEKQQQEAQQNENLSNYQEFKKQYPEYKGTQDQWNADVASGNIETIKRDINDKRDNGTYLKKIDDNTFTYGRYPQTDVDPSTYAQLDINGVLVNPNLSYYELEGALYEKSFGSYYKVEPITWKVVKQTGNQFYLMSEKAIDYYLYNNVWYKGLQHRVDYKGEEGEGYANNYKYSSIRTFLNTDFINKAFINGDDFLDIFEVDNSLASTTKPNSDFTCENTFDKVSMLSVLECSFFGQTNVSNDARKAAKTEYCNIQMHLGDFYAKNYQFAPYLLRTAHFLEDGKAGYVSDYGSVDYDGAVGWTIMSNCGIRPTITVTYDR